VVELRDWGIVRLNVLELRWRGGVARWLIDKAAVRVARLVGEMGWRGFKSIRSQEREYMLFGNVTVGL
jgi:hypothetical protein